MNKGTCLCGDISWQIDTDEMTMSNCHCSMCRKFHGSAYGNYVGVPASTFRWLAGEDRIRVYESSPGGLRSFCPRCGSKVATTVRTGEYYFMPCGNMEGDLATELASHIFAASKAPWFEITDDAKQWDQYPAGYEDLPVVVSEARLPATAGAIGGSCLCGKVRFEFDETLNMMGNCHCSRCRKSRSAPFSVQLFVSPDRFRWLSGEDNIDHFSPPGAELFRSSFCRDCGSMMPDIFEETSTVMVPAGSLDQDPGIRPMAHIYVGSKAPWFRITDDLPQFEEMPG